MCLSLKQVILLLVVGVGLSLGSELGSGNFDDLGSGNPDSAVSLPNGIKNSSKEAIIDDYIIVANEEDGSIQEEDDELSVEVEQQFVDGSGSGDHDDLVQNEMFNLVDVDDAGSGEGVGVDRSVGSDLGSGNVDDLGSGNVASTAILPNGITNLSKEAVIEEYIIVANEEDRHTIEENEDLYDEEQSVDGSGGSGSGEMFALVNGDDVGSGKNQVVHEEANGSGAEDENDLGSIEVNENVVNGYRIMGVSSNQVVPADSVEESLVENDEISLEVNVEAAATSDLPLDVTEAAATSELPSDVNSEAAKVEISSPAQVKKPEDDLGFLGMIASKRAMGTYPGEIVVTDHDYFVDEDYDDYNIEFEDHDEDLDDFNSDETTTVPYKGIFEARFEALVLTSPDHLEMKTVVMKGPGHVMTAGQGHTRGAVISVFFSFAIVCFFL